jgi:hypothetical protein
MAKKDLNQEINDFLDVWGAQEMIEFFNDVMPLVNLYNIDMDKEDGDWVSNLVDIEDLRAVRVARTAYLLIRFAEKHAGKMVSLKVQFSGLPKRMEKLECAQRSLPQLCTALSA